ncbi:MAG: GDP-mannose 4,6-dehydratase [Deltaproteobacteria bacterium]|nr:GDP-mannose 4,6-dehydratase [Deltaproteobacteria bacterium]
MRALITGIDGFAGRHLAALLAARGHAVHGLARRAVASPAGATVHPADVTDADAVARAVAAAAPERCFHLAGIASVPAAIADPSLALRVNALGTQHLLAAVARHAPAARVIVIGSGDAYGAVPAAALPVREAQPLQPRSPYGASKAAAEIIAGQWERGGGLDVVCVRAFNHTGPGQRAGFVCADFARQLVAIAAGTLPPRVAVGDLSPVRDFSDVRDVVAAYVAIAERGARGAVYNVCSGVGRSVREVLDALIGLVGVPVEVTVDTTRLRPADVPALVGDASALHAATGWAPRIAWEQTLADLIASLR